MVPPPFRVLIGHKAEVHPRKELNKAMYFGSQGQVNLLSHDHKSVQEQRRHMDRSIALMSARRVSFIRPTLLTATRTTFHTAPHLLTSKLQAISYHSRRPLAARYTRSPRNCHTHWRYSLEE